jgi:hypothetical protein
MRWLIDTLGGLYELAVLGFRTGFRLSGPYWRWRRETAFGADASRRPPWRQQIAAILEYGRWVYRMKRHRR